MKKVPVRLWWQRLSRFWDTLFAACERTAAVSWLLLSAFVS